MAIDRAQIEREFNNFFEFESNDRRMVTSVSCRLFAEHIAALSAEQEHQALTDEQIDAIFDLLPDGAQGFLKSWGYRQFARQLLSSAQARPSIDPDRLMDLVKAYTSEVAAGLARQLRGNYANASSGLEQIETDIRAMVAPTVCPATET